LVDPVDELLGSFGQTSSIGDVVEQINPDGSVSTSSLPLNRLDRYKRGGNYGTAPYRPMEGAIMLPARGSDGSWRNPDGTPRTVKLDPSTIVFTREPANGERGFPENVTLGQYAQELMDKHKTEVITDAALQAAHKQGLLQAASENDGAYAYLRRLKGLDARLANEYATPEYENIPIYSTNDGQLFRVGHQYNRNWDAIASELLEHLGPDSTGKVFSLDNLRKRNDVRIIGQPRLQQAIESGFQLGDPDDRGVTKFTRPDQTGGILIPELRTAMGANAGFTDQQTGRYIVVDDREMDKYQTAYGPGQFLDPGTRAWLKKQTDLPNAALTLPEVVQQLAGQADGPSTAPVSGAPVIDALRLAREKGVDLPATAVLPTRAAAWTETGPTYRGGDHFQVFGQGPMSDWAALGQRRNESYSTTQEQLLQDALVSARNADVAVQSAMPGMGQYFTGEPARGRFSQGRSRQPDPTSTYAAFSGAAGGSPSRNRELRDALVKATMPTRQALGISGASEPGATGRISDWEQKNASQRDERLAALAQPFVEGEGRRRGANKSAYQAMNQLLEQARTRRFNRLEAEDLALDREYDQSGLFDDITRPLIPAAESGRIYGVTEDAAFEPEVINTRSELAEYDSSQSRFGTGYQVIETGNPVARPPAAAGVSRASTVGPAITQAAKAAGDAARARQALDYEDYQKDLNTLRYYQQEKAANARLNRKLEQVFSGGPAGVEQFALPINQYATAPVRGDYQAFRDYMWRAGQSAAEERGGTWQMVPGEVPGERVNRFVRPPARTRALQSLASQLQLFG
jgi:hypothetical protein